MNWQYILNDFLLIRESLNDVTFNHTYFEESDDYIVIFSYRNNKNLKFKYDGDGLCHVFEALVENKIIYRDTLFYFETKLNDHFNIQSKNYAFSTDDEGFQQRLEFMDLLIEELKEKVNRDK